MAKDSKVTDVNETDALFPPTAVGAPTTGPALVPPVEVKSESKKPKYLTADEILDKDDVDYVEVPCPEWGGTVRLRTLTAYDAVVFSNSVKTEDGKNKAMIRIIAMCACDAEGKKIFSPENVMALMKKNLRVINRVQKAAMEHNGYTGDGEKAEDPTKTDFDKVMAGGSPSA